MEKWGGYVDPPSHLTKKDGKAGAGDLPPEMREVPDYDYSMFRYSRIAVPFLLILLLLALILLGLSLWQGPVGFLRGQNGLQDGVPRDFRWANADGEAGLPTGLRTVRIVQFCIGFVALVILVFGIAAQPSPGPMKGILGLSALLIFVTFVLAVISFAIGISKQHRFRHCRYHVYGLQPHQHYSPNEICYEDEGIAVAVSISDIILAFVSLLLFISLIFTLGKSRWPWGPGRVPVEKSIAKPRIDYPPASHFTHIHETRRLMVYILLLIFTLALAANFILMIVLHEQRARVLRSYVDGPEGDRNWIREKSGWPMLNTRFRLAFSGMVIGLVVLHLAGRVRWFAYILAFLLFWTSVGGFVVFAVDVDDLNKARDLPCDEGNFVLGSGVDAQSIEVRCAHSAYAGTISVEFILAFFLLVFVIWEYVLRSLRGWDTYYFFADSIWLRNHSLFVEQTDREAFDWKMYHMATGRPYYYSPTLGISTRTPPRNYVPEINPVGLGDSYLAPPVLL